MAANAPFELTATVNSDLTAQFTVISKPVPDLKQQPFRR